MSAFFLDINECLDDKVCQGGTCTNIKGFYTCECSLGYKYNHETKKCEDINECDKNPCVGGTCENNPGSFLCVCPTGSLLDASGKVCRGKVNIGGTHVFLSTQVTTPVNF